MVVTVLRRLKPPISNCTFAPLLLYYFLAAHVLDLRPQLLAIDLTRALPLFALANVASSRLALALVVNMLEHFLGVEHLAPPPRRIPSLAPVSLNLVPNRYIFLAWTLTAKVILNRLSMFGVVLKLGHFLILVPSSSLKPPHGRSEPPSTLSITLYGRTFQSFAALESWICRLPLGPERVDAWVDVVTQVNRFFSGASHFSLSIIRSIRTDASFQHCHWSQQAIDDLIFPLQAHVDADASIRDRYIEALGIIDREWGVEGTSFIEGKGYSDRTVKLVGSLSRRPDVPNLATGLSMVNARAVSRLLEGTNYYSRRTYVTPDDWLQVQDMPVPTSEIPIEDLVAAKVHVNNLGIIARGAPLIPIPGPSGTGRGSVSSCPSPGTGGGSETSPRSPPGSAPCPMAATPLAPSSRPTSSRGSGPPSRDDRPDRFSASPFPNTGSGSETSPRSPLAPSPGPASSPGSGPPCRDDRPDRFSASSFPGAGGDELFGAASSSAGGTPPITTDHEISAGMSGCSVNGDADEPVASVERGAGLWLQCGTCKCLQDRWCGDVCCRPPFDLLRGVGLLGAYFYSPISVCDHHISNVGRSLQLVPAPANVMRTRITSIWNHSLFIDHLTRFVVSRRDWFDLELKFVTTVTGLEVRGGLRTVCASGAGDHVESTSGLSDSEYSSQGEDL